MTQLRLLKDDFHQEEPWPKLDQSDSEYFLGVGTFLGRMTGLYWLLVLNQREKRDKMVIFGHMDGEVNMVWEQEE